MFNMIKMKAFLLCSFVLLTGCQQDKIPVEKSGIPPSDLVTEGPKEAAAAPKKNVIIRPDTEKQLIDAWGYDIKMASAIPHLTKEYAKELYENDGFNWLRVPIRAADAHPAPGKVLPDQYSDVLQGIKTVMSVKSDVKIFASLKLMGADTFPEWIKGNDGIDPAKYVIAVADYLKYMKAQNIPVHLLGIDNEMEYNKGNITPEKHKIIVDTLREMGKSEDFTVPPIIGPETYGPKADWVNELVDKGWGDRIDFIGTHYYPQFRPLKKLTDLLKAGGKRPSWNTEVHWDNKKGGVIDQAETCFITIFDGFDSGMSGMTWWAYNRTGIKGELMANITRSTIGAKPIEVSGSKEMNRGSFITRAFRQENDVVVWVINNNNTAFEPCSFEISSHSITKPVTYMQWTETGSKIENPALTNEKGFIVPIPKRTITYIRINGVYSESSTNIAPIIDKNKKAVVSNKQQDTQQSSQNNAANISVIINGIDITKQFVQLPMKIGNTILVPAKEVFKAMGAQVKWDENLQKVSAIKDGTTVEFTIGGVEAIVNDSDIVRMDQPAALVKESIMVPLDLLTESLDVDVKWDNASQTVTITE